MERFLPFGSQYYRAPTPRECDWENDIKNYSGHGFNTIKLWAQWRWNNPAQDVYYFEDLDKLMDLCHKYGLKVIINIIYDVAPAWLYKQYPDSVMITATGQRIEPTTSACRQIGGLPGPCFHHDIATEEKQKFTKAVMERYRNHPAMYIWDLWNEPELCYNARKPDVYNMVCYCDNTREKFIAWLQKRYGSLNKVNEVWARNYQSWDELELPREPRSFKDMIDWRLFFVDSISEDLRIRVELARTIDTEHEVMVHTVAGFNKINGCDDYEVAKMVDTFGGSTNNDPFACQSYASNARGKTCIASEIHANGGFTLDRGKIRNFNEHKEFILIPLSSGYKGFLYWQYRPELIGKEAPMWGLTWRDGSETEWLGYAREINKVLQDNSDVILEGSLRQPKTGIIYSLKNQIFNWCANYEINTHDHSVAGAFNMFYNLNINTDIVDIKQVCEGDISQYKVLYYPFPYYMDGETAASLKKWVEQGGVLISEAFFGSYNDDDGYHSITVPGFGMEEVFGAQEAHSTCTSQFIHSYDDFDGVDRKNVNNVEITLKESGKTMVGHYFYEELQCNGAEVLATFAKGPLSGAPAVTMAKYGKGNAVMIGTLLGKRYKEKPMKETEEFLSGLLSRFSVVSEIEVEGSDRVKADLIEKDGEAVMVMRNLCEEERIIRFRVRNGAYSNLKNLFDHKEYKIGRDSYFEVPMTGGEINLYRLK